MNSAKQFASGQISQDTCDEHGLGKSLLLWPQDIFNIISLKYFLEKKDVVHGFPVSQFTQNQACFH